MNGASVRTETDHYDVVGVGVPYLDIVVGLTEYPGTNRSAPIGELTLSGGGKVPTALAAAARLGLSAALVAGIADDAFGTIIRSELERAGVSLKHAVPSAQSALSIVVSERETAGRTILYSESAVPPVDVFRSGRLSARLLHISSFGEAEREAVAWAHREGIPVMLDADYYDPDFAVHARDVRLFIGSEHYFRNWKPEMALSEKLEYIYAQGPDVVIATLGEAGCMVLDERGLYPVPPFDIRAVDTTGAGDVFHGAYIYAYLQNWDYRDCAVFANAVAALKCMKPGGMRGIPNEEEIRAFLAHHRIDPNHFSKRGRTA
jgi:sugar/nucleoside kinase (ribokinase family)